MQAPKRSERSKTARPRASDATMLHLGATGCSGEGLQFGFYIFAASGKDCVRQAVANTPQSLPDVRLTSPDRHGRQVRRQNHTFSRRPTGIGSRGARRFNFHHILLHCRMVGRRAIAKLVLPFRCLVRRLRTIHRGNLWVLGWRSVDHGHQRYVGFVVDSSWATLSAGCTYDMMQLQFWQC